MPYDLTIKSEGKTTKKIIKELNELKEILKQYPHETREIKVKKIGDKK